MRDVMAGRGPDGAGLLRMGNVVLAHRRLAVIDTSERGHQPMLTPDGRHAIVYNGELYNDGELREVLRADRDGAAAFRSDSDTETVLHALAAWGTEALEQLRGMYALAWFDSAEQRLVLARDPLGIKPLYYAVVEGLGGPELVFASAIPAILAHPRAAARPDFATLSGYLTTIRTTLRERTLFDGVRTLLPGQFVEFDLSGETMRAREREVRVGPEGRSAAKAPGAETPAKAVRAAVEDSVRRHLRSDVPLCCLLSGGLDSSIVALLASRDVPRLQTYCAGAPAASGDDDFAFARSVSRRLGTVHAEAPVTAEMFAQRWGEMIGAGGVPLSTPNEVAINEVARRLRADGMVVTLSGEGADELFGGYDLSLTAAMDFEAGVDGTTGTAARARFQLDSAAWLPIGAKPAILSPALWRALEGDRVLIDSTEREFEHVAAERNGDDSPVQAHLRSQRRINLAGLLLRLDSATMREGVEGRTPLADRAVADLAEGLALSDKFAVGDRAGVLTKRVLREAFADDLPAEVLARPKASFPLPFQDWLGDVGAMLRSSALAREIFTDAAISMIGAEPKRTWGLAWPMMNIALWGRRWWG